MKKYLRLFIIFLLAVIWMTGCSGKPYPLKEPIAEIKSIEIVTAENCLEYSVVKTLSETEKEDFIMQFQEIMFYHYLGDPPDVYGDAVKITYQDGVYEMICHFSAQYVVDGRILYCVRSCNKDEFETLRNRYLG